MSSAGDAIVGSSEPDSEFVFRRAPQDARPGHPYALMWTTTDAQGRTSTREVGRGDYRWAVRTARMLSIPRASIEHDHGRGVDDGYEGWHLNARIVEP
ncbi:MAG: hypothetical protein WBF79_09070 [Rhodococcus sp. (in: high G+C Gram-positive bacteria)]